MSLSSDSRARISGILFPFIYSRKKVSSNTCALHRTYPEFFQFLEMSYVLDGRDKVVSDIKSGKLELKHAISTRAQLLE